MAVVDNAIVNIFLDARLAPKGAPFVYTEFLDICDLRRGETLDGS